jgi:hypothetical protein
MHYRLLLLLLKITVITSSENISEPAHEINIALLEEWERLPEQWAAIIEWSQELIRRDALIPADYDIKLDFQRSSST